MQVSPRQLDAQAGLSVVPLAMVYRQTKTCHPVCCLGASVMVVIQSETTTVLMLKFARSNQGRR